MAPHDSDPLEDRWEENPQDAEPLIPQGPRYQLTPDAFRQALITRNIVDEQTASERLGEKWTSGSVPEIEYLLVRYGLAPEPELRVLKGQVLGLPTTLDDAAAVPELNRELARSAGAVAVRTDRGIAIAFVDPTDRARAAVAASLGTAEFVTLLTTVVQWRTLFDSAYTNYQEHLPKAKSIEDIFEAAVAEDASDFHIAVGSPPMVRVDNYLEALEMAPIEADWFNNELAQLAGEKRWARYKEHWDADQAISYKQYRFRLNYGRDHKGPTLAGRLIPTQIPTPDQLGIPEVVRGFTELERGLVLVTGPTGSGKSTTLAALLNDVASRKSVHIITLEDPIEFFLNGEKALITQRELGEDFEGFAPALRQALRQDPDVILVGELRDRDTMRAALTAAETGHLVFGTLHTFDAVSTVSRIVSSFPPDEQDQARNQLAYLLAGAVSQTLVRKKTGGRVAAMEVLVTTQAVRAGLRKPDGLTQLRSTIETGSRDGMRTLEQALAALVQRGVISYDEGLFKARRKADFARSMGRSL